MKIIIIDDEQTMTKLLKLIAIDRILCIVETFNDPRLAFQRLQEVEFDVISLDHRMPGLTGMEMVKRLRTDSSGINHKTPILLFTGFKEEAENISTNLLNNLLFLEKPISDDRYAANLRLAYGMKLKESKAG